MNSSDKGDSHAVLQQFYFVYAHSRIVWLSGNLWFDNVELIAASEIGRETVQYVANILKYYIAYSLSLQQQIRKQEARDSAGLK